MSFIEQYQAAVHEELQRHPEWRTGQAYFNVLVGLRPDLAEQVRGSGLDPYHHDDRVPALLGMLAVSHNTRTGGA